MNCPHCQHQDHLEIDLHSDGFSSTTLLECTFCGALLSLKKETLATISQPMANPKKVAATSGR